MKVYEITEIRNVGIIGHGSSGKTSLTSALLFSSGTVNRLGRVDQGNTVTDFDEEEIARKVSISSALCYLEWKKIKLNIIDTPGYGAFIADAKAALRCRCRSRSDPKSPSRVWWTWSRTRPSSTRRTTAAGTRSPTFPPT